MNDLLPREKALALGARKYFTGKPCKYGHLAPRRVSNKVCVECSRLSNVQVHIAQRATPEARYIHNRRIRKSRRLTAERRREDNKKRRARRMRTPEGRLKEQRRVHRLGQKWRKSTPEKRLKENRRIAACNPIASGLRTRIGVAIRGVAKAGSAVRDLGCTISEFKTYIAAMFTPGMSWDNWGEWHLDHIKPLALFDLSDREQFLQACHYTNYQPLWAADNHAKGARYP
jgi:hypothetical protein